MFRHVLNALKNYGSFSGRASRSEYWYFFLFSLVVSIGLVFVDQYNGWYDTKSGYGVFSTAFTLFIIMPSISVGARRLHDTNRSAWWLLISIIPFFGIVALIYIYAKESQPKANRFGPELEDCGNARFH